MALPPLTITAADSASDQINHLDSRDDSTTPSGPSPSLWPEPAHPIPITARQVRFDTPPEMSTEGPAHQDRLCEEIVAEGGHAVSSSHSTTTRTGSDSTLPSSGPISPPPGARPINVAASDVFEPHYPQWFSYPPIHPTEFHASRSPRTISDESLDVTGRFLEQSSAFQNWVNERNSERIQLRHSPDYEKLVAELHMNQDLADYGLTPEIRADARQHILDIKEEMIEKRENISAAELQHIRDIEKAWVSSVSMDHHEKEASRRRHASTIPPGEPDRALSRVERLLGSDGSQSTTPSPAGAGTSAFQPIIGVSFQNEFIVGSIDLGSYTPKSRPLTTEELKQPPSADMRPSKPFELLVPEWFPAAEKYELLNFPGPTIEERFKKLLYHLYRLGAQKLDEEHEEKHPDKINVKGKRWDKHWHEPNPGWRHEHQRKSGGWWNCRRGPTAPIAENLCKRCHKVFKPEPESEPIYVAEIYENLMGRIEKAMAIVAEDDKMAIKERFKNEETRAANRATLKRQVDESVKLWATHADNPYTTAGLQTIPSSSRQPLINYNPLRGLDHPPAVATVCQADIQATVFEDEKPNQSDDRSNDESGQTPEPHS